MRVDRTRRPQASTPRRLRLPEIECMTLSNNLRVEFVPRREVPEVSLRLILESGAAAEPPDQAGLSELTSRLLTEGTADRDALHMASWLDRLGASYSASSGYSVATISMHLFSDVLVDAIEFLATTVTQAEFPENEVKRVRSERVDEIDRERDEPSMVAGQALISELYEDGLYGRPVGGTAESIPLIERRDVCDFYRNWYVPDGALLIACGDIERGPLIEAVEAHLCKWQGVSQRVQAPPDPPRKPGRILLADRPGSPQAEIRVGTIGVPYGTPNHHAIIVANAILGGLFNSRINMNLREEKGWTYGARSSFGFRRGAGPFVVHTAVESGVTAQAFQEILGEIKTMRKELVTEDELDLAKHALTLSLPLQFESARQITSKIAQQRIYDLSGEYWEVYRNRIEEVTAEQVREVCETYLTRDRMTLLAVTDAESVLEPLSELGTVNLV